MSNACALCSTSLPIRVAAVEVSIATPFTALVSAGGGTKNEFKPAFDWLGETEARLRKVVRNLPIDHATRASIVVGEPVSAAEDARSVLATASVATIFSPARALSCATIPLRAPYFPFHSFHAPRPGKRHRKFRALVDLRWRGRPWQKRACQASARAARRRPAFFLRVFADPNFPRR